LAADILPFVPKGAPQWLAPPAAQPALEIGPGGSLAGATELEVQQRALEANPMRRILDLECPSCWQKWIAPAQGACPSCGATDVVCTGERISMAQRLK
jgi:hypothetical protein